MAISNEALEKSGELAEALATVTKVGDLVVDESSGEIIEFPEGLRAAPERVAWLTAKSLSAQRDEKAWAAVRGFYNSTISKLMDEMGVERFNSEHGTARLVP